MRKRTVNSNQHSAATADEMTPIRFSLILLICGAILVVGFFFAARQHFASIDYGIKNSRLRKQIDELEAENRRLLLAREIALSPSEIRRSARKMGFTAMTAANIEAGAAAKTPKLDVSVTRAAAEKVSMDIGTEPRIIKTVLTVPAGKNGGSDKPRRPVKNADSGRAAADPDGKQRL